MKRDVDATVVGGATRHERAYWMFTVDEAQGSPVGQSARRRPSGVSNVADGGAICCGYLV